MVNTLAEILVERKANIWEQMKTITDTAANEKRGLTADECGRFDQGSADMTELGKQVERILASEAQNRALDEAFSKANGGASRRQSEANLNEDFRKLITGELREVDVRTEGRGLTGAAEKRALTKGTATAGGNLIVPTFYGSLVENLIESAAILQLDPTVLETGKGEDISVPITTSFGSAVLVPENGTIPQADPAFGKRALGAYKYAQLALVSRELIDDNDFDLEGFLARVMGRNLGLALNADLAVGNGSSKPAGVIPSATVGVTGGTGVAGVPTADNLIDLYFSVTAPYRNSRSAGWLTKDSTLASIRKMKDGSGAYLFNPATVVGAPDTFYGKRIVTDPNVAATGLNGRSVVFGDFSAYFVRLVRGVRFERSTEFKFDTDQVAFRGIIRGDGILVDQTGAIKAFVGGAS